jgi:hypothetical protein
MDYSPIFWHVNSPHSFIVVFFSRSKEKKEKKAQNRNDRTSFEAIVTVVFVTERSRETLYCSRKKKAARALAMKNFKRKNVKSLFCEVSQFSLSPHRIRMSQDSTPNEKLKKL